MEASAEAPVTMHHVARFKGRIVFLEFARVTSHNFPLGSFLAMEVLTHVRLRIGYQALKRHNARRRNGARAIIPLL